MLHEKVKSIALAILESCDCEEPHICDQCPFVNVCLKIFTSECEYVKENEAE